MAQKRRKPVLTHPLRVLNAVWPWLGHKLCQAAIEEAPPADLLRMTLSRFPIRKIVVEGRQGLFEGAAEDISVIQRYAIERQWSPRTADLVLRFFGPAKAGTYLDIGANVGLTVIPVAAGGIQTIAFEPVPMNFLSLSRNVEMNGVSAKVMLNNCALLDGDGDVTFEISPTNHGDHRLRRDSSLALMNEGQWRSVTVKGRRLDDFLDMVAEPLAIKIDTQGSEPLVVAGGQAMCARAALLICEFSPYAMNRMSADPENFIQLVAGFGSVSIFEGESEEEADRRSGEDLVLFLRDYYERHKLAPYGRYLNLIARR